jgi:oligopeptidase B
MQRLASESITATNQRTCVIGRREDGLLRGMSRALGTSSISSTRIPRGGRKSFHFPYRKSSAGISSDAFRFFRRDFFGSSSSSSSSSSTSTPHDPYDRFRHFTLTEDVWREIQEENERTRRIIDVELYDQVMQEILQAMEQMPSPIPELGPTGKFAYQFKDDPSGRRRIYQRQDVSKSQNEAFRTVVMDLSLEENNLQAMSLSVDEALCAALVESRAQQSAGGAAIPRSNVLIRHIDSGKQIQLDLGFEFEIASVEWGPLQQDGQHTLFLTENDSQGRPDSVWGCTIEMDRDKLFLRQTSSPSLYFQDQDPAIMVDIQRTKGCQYIAIQASTKTANAIYLCRDLNQPPRLVMPMKDGIVYHLDVGDNDDVYILVSDGNEQSGTNNRSFGLELSLWETTVDSLPTGADLDLSLGRLVSGAQEGFVITDMDIFRDFVALYERSTNNGTQRLRLLRKRGSSLVSDDESIIVPFTSPNEQCAVLSPAGNMHYKATSVRFVVDSPSCPGKTYEYDVLAKKMRMLSNPSEYLNNHNIRQKRVMVTSKDGTQVPLSLIYSEKPSSASETRYAVLLGYGSYGEPLNLSFDPMLKPLLDRNFVLAYAHTRGGGDLGKAWYHSGRLYQKQKAVEDFVACAQALVGEEFGITKPHKLTVKAFSAGGVIAGAAVNQQPELFGNVILTNAFLDVKRTMENDLLFLTEHEWDEFGNPVIDERAAESIAAYCPVSNAPASKENSVRFLLIGAFDDKQVPFWNSVIYGKKMRKNSRSGNRVFLHIENHGGHHLSESRLHVAALEVAFILGGKAAYYGMKIE